MPDIEKGDIGYEITFEGASPLIVNPDFGKDADSDYGILEEFARRKGITYETLLAQLNAGEKVHIEPQTGK